MNREYRNHLHPVIRASLSGLAFLAIMSSAHADPSADHPALLHALSDLRSARWLILHRPGDAAVNAEDDAAVREIEIAIRELNRAAIDDGKDISYHPQMDTSGDRGARLHLAVKVLEKTYADVAQSESDPRSGDLERRTLVHIHAAADDVRQAIHDAQ